MRLAGWRGLWRPARRLPLPRPGLTGRLTLGFCLTAAAGPLTGVLLFGLPAGQAAAAWLLSSALGGLVGGLALAVQVLKAQLRTVLGRIRASAAGVAAESEALSETDGSESTREIGGLVAQQAAEPESLIRRFGD